VCAASRKAAEIGSGLGHVEAQSYGERLFVPTDGSPGRCSAPLICVIYTKPAQLGIVARHFGQVTQPSADFQGLAVAGFGLPILPSSVREQAELVVADGHALPVAQPLLIDTFHGIESIFRRKPDGAPS
jgi:hypothetical protein